MLGTWTSNVANKPEEKASFEDYLRNSTRLLDRLLQIIEDKQAYLETKSHCYSEYDDAGWPYRQAHLNGRKAELAELKQLLTL